MRKVGHVVDAGVPSGRNRAAWLGARLKKGPVRLDAAAADMVGKHLGDDVGRLAPLLEMLAAAYGHGRPRRRRGAGAVPRARPAPWPRGSSPTPSTGATWPPP